MREGLDPERNDTRQIARWRTGDPNNSGKQPTPVVADVSYRIRSDDLRASSGVLIELGGHYHKELIVACLVRRAGGDGRGVKRCDRRRMLAGRSLMCSVKVRTGLIGIQTDQGRQKEPRGEPNTVEISASLRTHGPEGNEKLEGCQAEPAMDGARGCFARPRMGSEVGFQFTARLSQVGIRESNATFNPSFGGQSRPPRRSLSAPRGMTGHGSVRDPADSTKTARCAAFARRRKCRRRSPP
jgi:hypothetical protein